MKKYVFLILFIFTEISLNAQRDTLSDYYDVSTKTINQESANSKDIHSNFWYTSVNNIFGKNNSFSVNPSLYAVDSMLFKRARSSSPSVYKKQKILRRIQLIDSIKINNPNNTIAKLSWANLAFGLSIAIVDHRDITYSNFTEDLKKLEWLNQTAIKEIFRELSDSIRQQSSSARGKDLTFFSNNFNEYEKQHDYSKLDTLTKQIVNKLPKEEQDVIKLSSVEKRYTQLAYLYARKGLLTILPSYSRDVINKQSLYSFGTDYLKGFGKNADKTPWEMELKGSFAVGRDTTIAGSNYRNQLLSLSGGVNKVLAQTKDDKKQSTFELKGFFEYDHQYGNVPTGTERDKYTFNVVLRKKFFNSFWLPLTLSYDLKHPNLFGFLSLTINIDKGGSSRDKKSN